MPLSGKLTLAVLLVMGTGIWSTFVLFSDVLLGRPYWAYVVVVLVTHSIPGVAVGILVQRWWLISVLGLWGAFLMGPPLGGGAVPYFWIPIAVVGGAYTGHVASTCHKRVRRVNG